jgi:kynurenine formamidase
MFSDIFTGQPFIITDKSLFTDNKDRAGLPTGIPFIGKDLMDVQNEIMMKFRQTVGFDTAGVDKAERTNTLEIQSNDQYTETVLQIMLRQRKIAVESINAFFGTDISVDVLTPPQPTQTQGGEPGGTGDGGTGQAAGQNEL